MVLGALVPGSMGTQSCEFHFQKIGIGNGLANYVKFIFKKLESGMGLTNYGTVGSKLVFGSIQESVHSYVLGKNLNLFNQIYCPLRYKNVSQ